MGEIKNKYEELDYLPQGAMPIGEYARRKRKHRSYINVQYDRFKKGFINPNGKKYYGKDPGYTIILWCGKPYVIDNKAKNDY